MVAAYGKKLRKSVEEYEKIGRMDEVANLKFEIGVAKGKKLYDKRETEMRKTIKKETETELKRAMR